jgi:hypothetical protein
MFSVVEELSLPAFCKFAAPVSPRRNYQTYPTIPTPIPVCAVRAYRGSSSIAPPIPNYGAGYYFQC